MVGQINKLNITWHELGDSIGVHHRTLNDWKREKCLMSLEGLRKICKLSSSKIPENIRLKDPFWYTHKGARLGALATFKKYGRVGGNQEYQKKKWYEWWYKEGQYAKNGCIKPPLPIRIPHFSKDLAEFTGIVLGDGGISRSQVKITTNSRDDKQYAFFIKRLIKKLFAVNPSVYYRNDSLAMDIVVSRVKLVEFCNKKLGLKIGNKLRQNIDIPSWIRKNPGFEKACIRGLVDTDGCIFDERHNIKGKKYCYKRVNFKSASPELRKSVFDILNKLDLSPRIRNDECVQLEKKEKIRKYFEIIGTSNPKHARRFQGGVG